MEVASVDHRDAHPFRLSGIFPILPEPPTVYDFAMSLADATVGRARSWRLRLRILPLAACIIFAAAPAGAAQQPEPRPPARKDVPPAIVIGFLGGYVSRNSPLRSEVKLSRRLRSEYPENVR